ncbi:hypothetical protein PM082_003630 [Marasmius tenuissimus]|nr:hypothetical protein PM082_003630 [Marasmius tenuissimus]
MSASNTRLRNVTFSNRDLYLHYENGWETKGKWSSPQASGTMSFSDRLNSKVTFTFPQPAVAFYYYGLRRARGGLYGICIDCDPENMRFETVDALDRSDDGQNPPVVLFSRTFDKPGTHIVVLTNLKDTRYNPSGESQITVTRFVLEVDDSPQGSTQEQPTSVSSSSPATSESRSTTVGTDGSSSLSLTQSSSESAFTFSSSSSMGALIPSSSSNNDVVRSTAPVTIIGGAVGGSVLAIILIIVGVSCWCRKRARDVVAQDRLLSSGPSHPSPEVDISHNSLSSANSVVSPTRQLDAFDLLGNSEAATTPRMRSNLSFSRRAPSRAVIDGPRSLRTPPRLSFARFNPLSNHRSPVPSPIPVPYSQTHPAISTEERQRAGRNAHNHLSTTSGSGLRRSPLERRREVDAGPVFDEDAPEDEGMSTLPPLYEQVFRSPVDVRE